MAQEPSYPDDTPVGRPTEKADEAARPTGAPGDDRNADSKRTRNIVTGAAIGIGSAALVAALLYANRGRRKQDKDRS